jgi:hypothetical protein
MPKDDSFSGYVFPTKIKKAVESLISDSEDPNKFIDSIELNISRSLHFRLEERNQKNIKSYENKNLVENTIKNGKSFLKGMTQAHLHPKVSNLFEAALNNVLFEQYIREQYDARSFPLEVERMKNMSDQEFKEMADRNYNEDESMLDMLMALLSEDEKENLHKEIENYQLQMERMLLREILPNLIGEMDKLYKEYGLRKGPIPDYTTLDFIQKIGRSFAYYYQGKYKISAAEKSKFRELIELIMQETGVEIGLDMIEKRIKYVKKNYFSQFRWG